MANRKHNSVNDPLRCSHILFFVVLPAHLVGHASRPVENIYNRGERTALPFVSSSKFGDGYIRVGVGVGV